MNSLPLELWSSEFWSFGGGVDKSMELAIIERTLSVFSPGPLAPFSIFRHDAPLHRQIDKYMGQGAGTE